MIDPECNSIECSFRSPHGSKVGRHQKEQRGECPMFRGKAVLNTLTNALVFLVIAVAATSESVAQPETQFINILTGGTGGVYYPLGGALSNIFAKKVPGTKPSVQATKGSVENLLIVQQGRGELAFTLGDALALAWAGDADAGFRSKLDKLRGVAAIYPNYIQIVATKESGIKTLADVKGKSLSVGAAKSGTELNARKLLGAAGIAYKDLSKVEYLPFEESVDLMRNKQLDATLQSGGLGIPALRDFANAFSVTFVEVPAAVVAKVGVPYAKGTIPKETYKGQSADVQTATVRNYLVTRADLSADLVYNLTKAVFDSTAELTAAHSAAADIKLERALDGMPIPLHPGAQKFFKEKGLIK
jgi:TRAP transporter TAXI family solute receptor